uniref:Uncharacterized protein n=1 Tax=Chelonoidis abingdonii TaxID=106734 RepID=A0A8C0GIJ9_CHEAB
SIANSNSTLVIILSDTDEYQPPVWKSYCKYSNKFLKNIVTKDFHFQCF